MTRVKLETIAPVFLISELQSSVNDDCHFCVLTQQDITLIRQALFPVSTWRTRLGEWSGRFFDYTENETTKTWFKNIVDDLDYRISGEPMAYCLENVVSELQDIKTAIAGVSISQTCSAGGGSCGSICQYGPDAILEPDPADISETTPPGGMQVNADPTNIKRCNRINYLVDNIGSALHDLRISGVPSTVGFGVASTLTYLALWATRNPIAAYQVYKVIGYIQGIAAAISASVDFDLIDENYSSAETKEALVCAWYGVDDYDIVGAFSAMGDVLLNAGLNSPDVALVAAVAGVVGVSGIWFEETDKYPIYDEMDAYEGDTVCGDCSSIGYFELESWGELVRDGNSYECVATLNSYIWRLNIIVSGATGLGIENWVSDEQFGVYMNQITNSEDVATWLPIHDTPLEPFSQSDLTGRCVKILRLASQSAFSLSFTVKEC